MECLFNKCSVTNVYDRFVSCWICDGHAHIKCAGFNGRQFDKISSRENGLRWSCWNCRAIDIDFYRMFKEAQKSFLDINKDLASLMGKFKILEDMFKEFKWPENKMSSPPRKKPSKVGNFGNLNADAQIGSNDFMMFKSPEPSPNSIPASFDVPRVVVDKSNSPAADTVATSAICPPNSAVPVNTMILGNNVHEQPDAREIPPPNVSSCELVVVPPRMTVFISRLSANTSVENVESYIKSKCSSFNNNDCKVLKFNYSQTRDIASFRAIVPARIFDTLVNQSFWPPGVLVREFIPRNRPRREGAVNLQTASKN